MLGNKSTQVFIVIAQENKLRILIILDGFGLTLNKGHGKKSAKQTDKNQMSKQLRMNLKIQLFFFL